jgi:radical SAM superfamily enzyme with C-terminal helix-hairpin-helix motif
MLKVTILDGYVDEPTCLGVPPYISPYPRYTAGAIWSVDSTAQITYRTIDQLRTNPAYCEQLAESDIIIVIAGMVVPGRYLAGFPASPNELYHLLISLQKPLKILGGPAARFGFGLAGGKHVRDLTTINDVFDLIVPGDIDIVTAQILQNNGSITKIDPTAARPNAQAIRTFAAVGAPLITQHPQFPAYLICEIETYRGCSRQIAGGCSFCCEPFKGPPDFREEDDIITEIGALYSLGCRHFRLGNQPCIFSYKAHNARSEEFPRPNPDALERLFKGIRNVAPQLLTLHIDNANPGIIARYPTECRRIAQTIIRYHTSGDVAALGVESVDPVVIQQNNLKANADEVRSAIKLLNEVGAHRGANGMPELLPGLNFLFGLQGETKHTFDCNYEFLQDIVNKGYLLRRINLRQAIPLPGTRLYSTWKSKNKYKMHFQRFKKQVKETIERPLLEILVPQGTVLHSVYTEKYEGKTTFGRQLGSYPLLIGIPGVLPLHTFYNVAIVDYGYRSVTAIPHPLAVNTASLETLIALPNVGKKRAIRIIISRPYTTQQQFIHALDDPTLAEQLLPYLTFKE